VLSTKSPDFALLADQPTLLDVRAEQEYHQGHLPNSINLPILNDDERRQVGTVYKQQGQQAAVDLGHKLVSGDIKKQRVSAWQQVCEEHDDVHIMCWRGGQRSTLAQQWLENLDISRPRIAGGFKALRQQTIEILDQPDKHWWLLSGRTGSAKTVIIQNLPNSIDLEKRANHRGSAFGKRTTPQPSTVTFECALAVDYLHHHQRNLVVEDESRTIGSVGLPQNWHRQMQQADIALVESSIEERTAHIEQEYVFDALTEAAEHGLTAQDLQQNYQDALLRIGKRLGGARLVELQKLLEQGFAGRASHQAWINYLLTQYYDPMYDYQLSKKQHRICFRGNGDEVKEFLNALN
jgi:tRNA 2-selenouridine synthase